MAPKRASHKSPSASTTAKDDDSVMGGTGNDDNEIVDQKEKKLKKNMATDMVTRDKLRKVDKQQQELADTFETKVRALEKQIEKGVAEYQEETKGVQDAFVARLLALTQKKASIEKQIVQHVQEHAAAYESIKIDFEAVLKGRCEDFHDAHLALRELQEQGTVGPNEQH